MSPIHALLKQMAFGIQKGYNNSHLNIHFNKLTHSF